MHINRDLLMAFYRGEVSAEELLRLAQEHLLGHCRYCSREFEAFCGELKESETGAQEAEARYPATQDRIFTLTRSRSFQASLAQAQCWQRELEPLPKAQQLSRVQRARTRFRGVAFGYLMLQQARSAVPGDPGLALHYARLAQLAVALEEDGREIFALALAHQANAHRVLGQDDDALRLFDQLQTAMYPVTDTRTVAEVASLEGSMAFDHRHFSDASSRFTRAISLYRLLQDAEGEAKNLLNLGSNAYYSGNVQEAITLTRAALQLVVDEDGDLYLGARHNLGIYLVAAGAVEEVAQMLVTDMPLYRRRAAETPQWNMLFFWLAGKVAFEGGNLEQAEALFLQTRLLFSEAGQDYDAALLGLDLVRLYMEQQRLSEALPLAQAMLPVFQRYELAPEILELLSAFELAVQRQQVGLQLLRRLALRLGHARRVAR